MFWEQDGKVAIGQFIVIGRKTVTGKSIVVLQQRFHGWIQQLAVNTLQRILEDPLRAQIRIGVERVPATARWAIPRGSAGFLRAVSASRSFTLSLRSPD